MLIEGVSPQPIQLSGALPSNASLRAGQVFETNVRGQAGSLALQLATLRIPLDADTPLTPGQAVRVEIQGAAENLRLVVRAESAASAPPQQTVGATLSQVLRTLGASEWGGRAAQLLPRGLPADAQAVRQLMSVLLARENIAGDIAQLAAMLRGAAEQGNASPAWAQALGAWASALQADDAPSLEALLKRLKQGRGLEARLALALRSGEIGDADLDADARATLLRAGGDEPLRSWLRGQGQLKDFDAAAQRVLDRVAGTDVQNLHAFNQRYVFLDLPLPHDKGWNHAQAHFFSEGGGKKTAGERPAWDVVLDCSTTRLGDLWVQIRAVQGQCICRFRVADEAARAALETAAPELNASLREAGFVIVGISVEAWDGDRLRELLALARRFGGAEWTA